MTMKFLPGVKLHWEMQNLQKNEKTGFIRARLNFTNNKNVLLVNKSCIFMHGPHTNSFTSMPSINSVSKFRLLMIFKNGFKFRLLIIFIKEELGKPKITLQDVILLSKMLIAASKVTVKFERQCVGIF